MVLINSSLLMVSLILKHPQPLPPTFKNSLSQLIVPLTTNSLYHWCKKGTLNLSLLVLSRTPSHNWYNLKLDLPKPQCEEKLWHTTKDPSSPQDHIIYDNTSRASQCSNDMQICSYFLGYASVCFCHNTPYILHIGRNHFHQLPSYMHNKYHAL